MEDGKGGIVMMLGWGGKPWEARFLIFCPVEVEGPSPKIKGWTIKISVCGSYESRQQKSSLSPPVNSLLNV